MVRGVEGLRHQGITFVAPSGSLILINPADWHENYSLDPQGFEYRSAYVPIGLMRRIAQEYIPGVPGDLYLRQCVETNDETLVRLGA
jgi:hypothetical protein